MVYVRRFLLGFAILLSVVLFTRQYRDITYREIPASPRAMLSSAMIHIPVIQVSASIESLGVTKEGNMDAPVGPTNVGWFNQGAYPGKNGVVVMDGHSGFKNGVPAVFDLLYKVQSGDLVLITDEFGVVHTYAVDYTRSLNPMDDATSVFTSTDGKAHLNLITCSGVWNSIQKTHSKRLVVFTTLVT